MPSCDSEPPRRSPSDSRYQLVVYRPDIGLAGRLFRPGASRLASRRTANSPSFRCRIPTAGQRPSPLHGMERSGSPKEPATGSAGWRLTARDSGSSSCRTPAARPGSLPSARTTTCGSPSIWATASAGSLPAVRSPSFRFRRPTASRAPSRSPRTGTCGLGEFTGNRIGRVTPQGVITEFPIPTPDSGPRAVAAGPDGNVWFSEFNAGKIGRMTRGGQVTEFALPRPNSGPGDITTGADGNMWFLLLNGRMDGRQVDGNRVGRITPEGKVTEFAIPSQTGSPINIAVGSRPQHLVHQAEHPGPGHAGRGHHRVRHPDAQRWRDRLDRGQRSSPAGSVDR